MDADHPANGVPFARRSTIKVNGPEIISILESVYGSLDTVEHTTALAKYVNFAKELGSEGYAALIGAEM